MRQSLPRHRGALNTHAQYYESYRKMGLDAIVELCDSSNMTDVTLRKVPEGLMRKVKAQAALQGLTMKQFIMDALEKTLREIGESRKSTRGSKPRK